MKENFKFKDFWSKFKSFRKEPSPFNVNEMNRMIFIAKL